MNKENTINIAKSSIRDFIVQSRFDTSVLANNAEAKSILTAAESDTRDIIIENKELLETIGTTIVNTIVPHLKEGIHTRLQRKATQTQNRADILAKALEDLQK